MSEQELIELCQQPNNNGRKILYWTSEVYGFGKYLREYCYYPKHLPLNIYFSHGVTHHDTPAKHEYENTAPAILFFSPRLTEEYKKHSKKLCKNIVSPNVYYRRKYKIEQDKNAVGTLAFPCHTTPDIDDLTDYNDYAKKLKSLPAMLHPVSVCLHYHDINKGLHKVFLDHGFEVFTVGHPYHPDFIERFYHLLRKFKYITSNELGSYTYYAVEMSIPFLLYGNAAQFVNIGDHNYKKGIYDSYKRTRQMQRALNLFSDSSLIVTKDQKRFVEKELGVYDSISRLKASQILYGCYLRYLREIIKLKIKQISHHLLQSLG